MKTLHAKIIHLSSSKKRDILNNLDADLLKELLRFSILEAASAPKIPNPIIPAGIVREAAQRDIDLLNKRRQQLISLLKELISPRRDIGSTAYAKALDMAGIVIDKKGVGVTDGIDYGSKFGLAGSTLYQRMNDLTNGRRRNTEDLEKTAREIIKRFKL